MKKESLSTIIAKTLLALLVSSRLGPIIVKTIEENQGGELEIYCKTDSDCMEHLSLNTCESICANINEENRRIIDRFKRTCNPNELDMTIFYCKCIDNKCQRLEEDSERKIPAHRRL